MNVLVYAFRREADAHEEYAAWLSGALAGDEDLAMVDAVLTGFVRIVSNPRIFSDPAPTALALSFVRTVRSARPARAIAGAESTWDRLDELVAADRYLRGNLVPDAWLAAVAATIGARIATADAGFARFGDVEWFDPVA